MTLLSKADILKIQDLKYKDVNVPEWGGTIRLSSLSGTARAQFEASIIDKDGKVSYKNMKLKLVAASIVDSQGNLMFDDSTLDQLGKKSATVIDRLYSIVEEINVIGDDNVEDLAKNS